MIFQAIVPTLKKADKIATDGGVEEVLECLREVPLRDFGSFLIQLPHSKYSNLSRVLPKMADPDIQRAWTGSDGYALYQHTADFSLRLEHFMLKYASRDIRTANILDFGSGWGRLARMMSYFVDPDRFTGLDPMQQSLDICAADRVLGRFALSDYLPVSLPVGDEKFDLIYSYSVFTHTSERATLCALKALRDVVSRDGILVLTIRPIEIWDRGPFGENPDADVTALKVDFITSGFSYLPNPGIITDGDYNYGVTAIDPRWFDKVQNDWRVVGVDRGYDETQFIIVLKPV